MEDSSSEALGASQIEENHVAKVSSPERRGKSNLFKSPKPNIKSRNENIFGDNNIIETEKREVNDNEQDIVTPVSEPFKITTQNKDTHSFDEKSNNEEEEYIPWWEVEMRKAKAIQEATEISIQEPPTQVSQTVINEKQLNTQVSLADKNKAYFKQKKQVPFM